MSMQEHFVLLANYNQWMNTKVYQAAGQLDAAALTQDRGAYFGSILGSLNHILVADIIWLKRFATHPSCGEVLSEVTKLPDPISLDQCLFADLEALTAQRVWLDRTITDWVDRLDDADMSHVLNYHNVKRVPGQRRFSSLVLHFFNHQTHHRGQVSTLLSQAGVDLGVTDLLALIPDQDQA